MEATQNHKKPLNSQFTSLFDTLKHKTEITWIRFKHVCYILQYCATSLKHFQLFCAHPWRCCFLVVYFDIGSQLSRGSSPDSQRSRYSLMAIPGCQPIVSGRFLLSLQWPGDWRTLRGRNGRIKCFTQSCRGSKTKIMFIYTNLSLVVIFKNSITCSIKTGIIHEEEGASIGYDCTRGLVKENTICNNKRGSISHQDQWTLRSSQRCHMPCGMQGKSEHLF